MDFRVEISPLAIEELAEITEYISVAVGEIAATSFGEQLLATVESLSRFPNRHAKIRWKSRRRKEYRKVSVGPYLIYYHVNERSHLVTVIHFWHGARQTPFL